MSKAMTVREIRIAVQRENLSSAACAELRQEIQARRTALKARIEAITRELREEPERLIELTREDEQIEVDLGVLYECENASFKLIELARNREAGDVALNALRQLREALKKLETINVEHAAAASTVEGLLTTICESRIRLLQSQEFSRAKHGVPEELVDRLVAASCYPSRLWTPEQIAITRRRLVQQCA